MKSITEILGGAQTLLGVSFELQDCFEEYLNEEQRTFLAMLGLIADHLPPLERGQSGLGRPAFERDGTLCPRLPGAKFFPDRNG
ncbi:MAG: hypothetical protein ABSF43_14090 [Rectinemataceae bacterium]|jgi:hypothetical protein